LTVNRIRLESERVIIRPLRMDEFEASWASRLQMDSTVLPVMPERDALRARFERSGIMEDGALDLAVEVDGRKIGEIQTYVPPGRTLPTGAFEVGIGIDDPSLRGKGYGTEAVRLFVGWLFAVKGATRVHMPTVPTNIAMRTVLERLGFVTDGTTNELGHEFVFYVVTRDAWTRANGDRQGELPLLRPRSSRIPKGGP
jgi:RimJ/RimL family protein N-acetyltransferase